MNKIKSIFAREILDSLGNPTIETVVYYEGGWASASVPSGISTGKYEMFELRDNDPKRFKGMGVRVAVNNVNNLIAGAIVGMDVTNQLSIDKKLVELDGTPNKAKLGANSILSVSMAVSKAGSYTRQIPLYLYYNELIASLGHKTNINIPTPILNIINGGKHGTGNLDFQEFHIIPASNKTYPEGLRMGVEIYHTVRDVLKYRNAIHAVGEEGGFAPNLFTNLDAFEILGEAIKQAGYALQRDVFLGLDIAPSYFYKDGSYQIKDVQEKYSAAQFIEYIRKLHKEYHLYCLEDPLQEDSWADWSAIMRVLGNEVLVIGDDLIAGNIERLKKAIQTKAVNAVLIKPNQIGTISETMLVIKLAKENNLKVIISHRSGETTDDLISDFAVGIGADFVKFGAPARGERVSKYNRLLSIIYDTQKLLL